MTLRFENYSTYSNPEDIKRLRFVVHAIQDYVSPGCKIFDMGCGKGNMAMQLAKMGYDVTAIDSDKLSIDYAESLVNLPNIKFVVSTVEDFPFIDHSADVIICSEILEHLVDPHAFIKKIVPVLKMDGIMIITVPNGRGPRELFVTRPFIFISNHFSYLMIGIQFLKKILGYNGSDQSKAENLEHLHFFTLKHIRKIASNNGFNIVRKGKSDFIENTFPISLLTNHVYFLKIWDNIIADYLPYFMVSGFYTILKRTKPLL